MNRNKCCREKRYYECPIILECGEPILLECCDKPIRQE